MAKEGLKGYIYVEAFKQTHVKQMIEGVGNLRMGQWSQQVRVCSDFLTSHICLMTFLSVQCNKSCADGSH